MEEHRAAQGVGRDQPGRGREHLQPLPGAELARDRAGRHLITTASSERADQRRPDRGVDEPRRNCRLREVDVAEAEACREEIDASPYT